VPLGLAFAWARAYSEEAWACLKAALRERPTMREPVKTIWVMSLCACWDEEVSRSLEGRGGRQP
jgi:hypothetical protein